MVRARVQRCWALGEPVDFSAGADKGGLPQKPVAGPGVLRLPEPSRARKKLKGALRARPIWSTLVDSQHSFALRRAASRRDGAGPCPSVRTSPPSCEETAPTVSASAIPPRPDAPSSSAAARRGGSGSLPPRRRSSPAGTVVARAGAAEGFPRSARIRKRADFLRVQQRGKKVTSGPLVGLILPATGFDSLGLASPCPARWATPWSAPG